MPDLGNKIATDKVFIKDLSIDMSAGIYDHEKAAKQRVIVNITVDVESNFGKSLKSISDVASYEELVNNTREISLRKHYELLEELAEDLCTMCLQQNNILQAKVRLEKPDIIADTNSVGVEIVRRKRT